MKEDIKYLSISELNRIIKMKFDSSAFFNRVFIKGEISNFKVQMPSGHCYFTIKDEMSRISAVMFKGTANKVGTNFKDGDMVNVVGKISVYEASGNYQIYIESMELNGSGDLYKKFLLLKEKLYKEGLFDESHKKQIPKYPKKIGVVTASTGAAIRDIITTIKRRYPLCEVILFPSLVQGVSAKEDIVKKIELANTFDIDTLIVGRGGGSIEDLWAYNEEIVARAIYNSKVPIISAVGHEIDFTIADYVADKRAATPTGAAELAVPNIYDISMSIDTTIDRITNPISFFKVFENIDKAFREYWQGFLFESKKISGIVLFYPCARYFSSFLSAYAFLFPQKPFPINVCSSFYANFLSRYSFKAPRFSSLYS